MYKLNFLNVFVFIFSVSLVYLKINNYDFKSVLWFFAVAISVVVVKYHWSRRWLYYYASKFDGPFALPLVGNVFYCLGSVQDITKNLMNYLNDYQDRCRGWIGPDLYIINSRPEDVEIILSKCLEKVPAYKVFTANIFNDSIFVSPVNQWRKNRKLINHTFNPTVMKSYQSAFAKGSNTLIDYLNKENQNKSFDILPKLWSISVAISFETLYDCDLNLIDDSQKVTCHLIRLEEICSYRLAKPWLHPEIIWKMTKLCKEANTLVSGIQNTITTILNEKKLVKVGDEDKKSRFVNYLLENEDKLTNKELEDEFFFMIAASTETLAVTESFLFLVLAILPDVQQKVYEEVYAIFGNSKRDATLEDLNQMTYLERVIKESMRLLPTALLVARYVDKETKIGDYVYPKGASVIIPIVHIHRNPKYWKNPLAFDPDRFLPEETQKRHRCAYIPLSYGPRNCPGNQYAMMMIKTIFSTFVRYYKVVSCNYQRLEDINFVFNVVTQADKGFDVVLEKRK